MEVGLMVQITIYPLAEAENSVLFSWLPLRDLLNICSPHFLLTSVQWTA